VATLSFSLGSKGTINDGPLVVFFGIVTAVLAMRRPENEHLFILGKLSFKSALLGRPARRYSQTRWPPMHISGLCVS
jgi:hypothetical protein